MAPEGMSPATSYANDSLRQSDVDAAYSRLEDAGYTQNLRGDWDASSD